MRFARSRLVLMLILGVTTERAEAELDLAAVKNAPKDSRNNNLSKFVFAGGCHAVRYSEPVR